LTSSLTLVVACWDSCSSSTVSTSRTKTMRPLFLLFSSPCSSTSRGRFSPRLPGVRPEIGAGGGSGSET
jgi:hypothetical protein